MYHQSNKLLGSRSGSGYQQLKKITGRERVILIDFTLEFFPAILRKGPWPKLGKNDRLNIKIGRN